MCVCASCPWVRESFLCHTWLQKSLMRSWEEVGVVWKEVRWRKGKGKYYCQKYLCQKYFQKNIFAKNIFKNNFFCQIYFQKKYFCQKYFWKNSFTKNIFKEKNHRKYFQKNIFAKYFSKKKVGAKPPCCPQGLGWYRAIARSQPSIWHIGTHLFTRRRLNVKNENLAI